MNVLSILAAVCLAAAAANADVLYSQPHTGTATQYQSCYMDPDGSDLDEFVWDSFSLTHAANITGFTWRGGGAEPITNFEIAIYASIANDLQPYLGGPPLKHYFTADYGAANAGETYAGTFQGVPMYDYHFNLPQAFSADANTVYWVQIIAWTPTWPSWGLAAGSGGNGTHFARVLASTGDFRFVTLGGDTAFSVIGTPKNCTGPSITQNPTPQSICYGASGVSFSTAASGTGTLTYRWRRNGVAIYDGMNSGGSICSGATTPTLTITNPNYWYDPGAYDCIVYNACTFATCASATLSVGQGSPSITTQPAPERTCPGGDVAFSVTASASPTSYQWKKGNVAISDGAGASGAIFSGAHTASLSISGAQTADQGSYSCTVGNACGSATSDAASLAVCQADYNCDGFVNGDDYDFFAGAFDAGEPGADFNHDGFVNGDDYDGFAEFFDLGC
ncbi:MAG: immunoglobulin domain-containing protein [Phycisphaerales bacterium]